MLKKSIKKLPLIFVIAVTFLLLCSLTGLAAEVEDDVIMIEAADIEYDCPHCDLYYVEYGFPGNYIVSGGVLYQYAGSFFVTSFSCEDVCITGTAGHYTNITVYVYMYVYVAA